MAGSKDGQTFTCRVEDAARLWCLRGLWYAGVDLWRMGVSGVDAMAAGLSYQERVELT